MFIVVLIVFGVCWLPYHAYFLFTYYHDVGCFCFYSFPSNAPTTALDLSDALTLPPSTDAPIATPSIDPIHTLFDLILLTYNMTRDRGLRA